MLKANDRSKAKDVIVDIIRQSEGEFHGKTRLYKAFLFAHLFYFDRNTDFLTEWPIVHMTYGHGIEDGETLLDELVAAARITRQTESNGPFRESVFRLRELGEGGSLSAAAVDAIRLAVEFLRNKSGGELSDLIHEHSRSYNEGKSGDELNIYVDLLDDVWLEQTSNRLRIIDDKLRRAFFAESS